MDIQHALLSKVILNGDLKAVVNARITTDFFTDDRYQRVFGFLLKHWQDYGVAPDESVVHTAFPSFEWEQHPQPLEYFIDRLRERRKRSILTEGLNTAAGHFQSDDPNSTHQIESALQDALVRSRVETSSSLDEDLSLMRASLVQRFDDRMENPGHLRGISTGFDGIDYVTGGLQSEHFVVLIGTIKSFKSATLLAMALAVHRQAKVGLFIGFEMSNVEQFDRAVSLISGVSLTKIMNGTLNAREFKRVEEALRDAEQMRSLIFSSDITSTTTVSGIQAKIMDYTPDVVFIDGAYMMQAEGITAEPGTPQALTQISRSLKKLAQSSKIPIVITTQASLTRSRQGLTGGSAMYTQAWGQDCDIMLGTERQVVEGQSEATDPVQVKFKVVESRSGPRKEVILEWDWNRGSVEELDPAVQHRKLQRNGTASVDDGTGEDWEHP